jgi:uncharacterized Tic20 family protein
MYPPTQEERTMAMLCHLTGLLGAFLPPANILAPLIIWLLKKDWSQFVNDQGKEVLNFQISMTIYFVVGLILMIALIGFLIFPLVGLFWLVFGIIGTIKAYNGVYYRFPLTIRLVK